MAFHIASFRLGIAAIWMATSLWLPASGLAATVTTIGTIPGTSDGANPTGALTMFEGVYYGTTSGGSGTGVYGAGTVYRINLKTGVETPVYQFTGGADGANPVNALTVLNGKLYGTTYSGGANQGGVVFSIDPATETETVVASLPGGTFSQGRLAAYNGLLFGTGLSCRSGNRYVSCIFSIDPATGQYSVAHAFEQNREGQAPGSLLQHGDYLFGTARGEGESNAGTLFRFDPATNALRVEHAFGAQGDGMEPADTLVELGGILYGTTLYGGQSNAGTLFSLDPAGRQETILHSFGGPEGSDPRNGLYDVGGVLYGATAVAVFAFDPSPAMPQLNILHSFDALEVVNAPFIAVNGTLVGVSTYGGAGFNPTGQVFTVGIDNGQFTVLHDFGGSDNDPYSSSLIKVGRNFYGLSIGGGSIALGSIFKVQPSDGNVETVHSFQGTDGADPEGTLLAAPGMLFGTTAYGGAYNFGTLFSFDPSNHKLTTLHEFNGSDGQHPTASLTLVNGTAYGTTIAGGSSPHGVVFSLDTATLQENTVASFTKATGYQGSSMTLLDGILYGVASTGGTDNYGTVFKLDPATGKLTGLYSFLGGDDGANPKGPLCLLNGIFYGVTSGSRGTAATVFAFDPSKNMKTTLHVRKKHLAVNAGLVAKGNALFGTIASDYGGTAPYGGVFKLDLGSVNATIYPFAQGSSVHPQSALLRSDGALFGTALSLNETDAGTVYKFVP